LDLFWSINLKNTSRKDAETQKIGYE